MPQEGPGVLIDAVAGGAGREDARVMPREDMGSQRLVLLERLVGAAAEEALQRDGVGQLAALPRLARRDLCGSYTQIECLGQHCPGL